MELAVWVCLLAAAPVVAAAADGGRAEYVGGTLAGITNGVDGRLRTTHEQYFEFAAGKDSVRVPYARINLLEYGQNVGRRYAMAVLISPMFLLSKSRRHFLTVGYTDDEGRQQAMVFQVGKADIRTMLVTLEARTGRKVEFQDEEARKAGKG